MSRYVSPEVRRRVAARADFLCEYCLIAEEDTFFGCEVEHVISLKHGGSSEPENLAYACTFCNRHKGSDIGSVFQAGDFRLDSIIWDWGTLFKKAKLSESVTEFSRFFNPRIDRWAEHFELPTGRIFFIRPKTIIGAVTARVLQFNHPNRLLERFWLSGVGRYPSAAALVRIQV